MAAASTTVFDRLFEAAVPALTAGSHRVEEPPVDGGRWPVSVVCVPDAGTQATLQAWMREAARHAGPGHFRTGTAGASHFTVRALEPYREAARPDDPEAVAWSAAVDAAARDASSVRLRLTGVTLSSSAVMAQAEPADEAAWELMRAVRRALGPLAWYEEQWQPRDIWYSSILHFGGPLADASALVEWAAARRRVDPVTVTLTTLSLVRFRYREGRAARLMAMEPWHTASLRPLPGSAALLP